MRHALQKIALGLVINRQSLLVVEGLRIFLFIFLFWLWHMFLT